MDHEKIEEIKRLRRERGKRSDPVNLAVDEELADGSSDSGSEDNRARRIKKRKLQESFMAKHFPREGREARKARCHTADSESGSDSDYSPSGRPGVRLSDESEDNSGSDDKDYVPAAPDEGRFTKVHSGKSLAAREYSDDEEELREKQNRAATDSWLSEVDKGRSTFKSEEEKEKALKTYEEVKAKKEAQFESRCGRDLSNPERIDLLLSIIGNEPKITPASYMIKVKAEAQAKASKNQPVEARPKGKKVFVRPAKLPPALQEKIEKVTALCDELSMDGIQTLTETRGQILKIRERLLGESADSKPAPFLWNYRESPHAPIEKRLTTAQVRDRLSEGNHESAQVQQTDPDGYALDGLWLLADTISWDLTT